MDVGRKTPDFLIAELNRTERVCLKSETYCAYNEYDDTFKLAMINLI